MEDPDPNMFIKTDFKTLLNKGTIAFYNSAEITTIFLTERSSNPINIFTLIVFEEKELNEDENGWKDVTDNLISIDKRSLGISQQRINLDDAEILFNELLNRPKILEFDDKHFFEIDQLKILSKQFVPGYDEVYNKIPLNNVLKNNEENGSYVFEFFSEEKEILNSPTEKLEEKNFRKMCKEIMEYLPIDLLFVKDRISNIIFQFPITLISVDTKALDDYEGIELRTEWHPLITDLPDAEFFVYTIFDDIIISSKTSDKLNGKIVTGDIRGENKEFIKDKRNDLILWFSDAFYVERILTNAGISVSEPRLIEVNGERHSISLFKHEEVKIGNFSKDYKTLIESRSYKESTKKLIKNKEFLQYATEGSDDKKKAIEDLRHIIEKNCENGIYIWDPYADSEDIINTAYFCKYYNKKIRVITSCTNKVINKRFPGKDSNEHSLKKSKFDLRSIKSFLLNLWNKKDDEKDLFQLWRDEQIRILNSNSNNLGINLEIRCQRDNYGWKFHDRFLIFPLEKPKVWSLGTSINSIGKKKHCILMSVNNPQNILDSFNNLWDELDKSVLYKYPE
jgi:hypothetical protein